MDLDEEIVSALPCHERVMSESHAWALATRMPAHPTPHLTHPAYLTHLT
jgi:hypothetical protein